MRLKIAYGERVRDHKALEAPLLAQNVVQQPAITAGRHIVQIHIGAHEGCGSSLFCRMERNQVDIPEQRLGNVGRVVVAASFRRAVAGEVLDAGQNTIGTNGFTLKTAHLRHRHSRSQVRILARAFDDPAPAGIACYIDHGGKGPLDSSGARILGSLMLGCFFDTRVPRRRHGQRYRKNRPITVDHIEADDQGNVEPGLFHGHMLHTV